MFKLRLSKVLQDSIYLPFHTMQTICILKYYSLKEREHFLTVNVYKAISEISAKTRNAYPSQCDNPVKMDYLGC